MGKLILSKHLRERIQELENQRDQEFKELKENFQAMVSYTKPSNLIKQGIGDLYNNILNNKTILTGIAGVVLSFFFRKKTKTKNKNTFARILETIIEFSIPILITTFMKKKEKEEKEPKAEKVPTDTN